MHDRKTIGKPIRFKGAEGKVTGKARYLDDLELPGMLHMKILRSPHAHARLSAVDTSRAQTLPGVKAVLAAADCPDTKFGLDVADATVLARDKVRYAGEEVAAVAAESIEAAERAIEMMQVDYDILPSHTSPEESLKEEAFLIHEDKPGNIAVSYQIERGVYQKVLESCAYVYEEEFSTSRVLPCSPEPFGVIADWTSGRLQIHTGVQAIFQARSELAKALAIDPSDIIVNAPTIGGKAFGGEDLDPELHLIAALLSRKAGRPVKYVMTREEEIHGQPSPRAGQDQNQARFLPKSRHAVQGNAHHRG